MKNDRQKETEKDFYYPVTMDEWKDKKISWNRHKEWWAYERRRWLISILRFQNPFRSIMSLIMTVIMVFIFYNDYCMRPFRFGQATFINCAFNGLYQYAVACCLWFFLKGFILPVSRYPEQSDFIKGSSDFYPWGWDWQFFMKTGYRAKLVSWLFLLIILFIMHNSYGWGIFP